MEKIKELIKKMNVSVPESFVPSMKYLLVTLMPAIALFHAFIEIKLEIYYAVIVFILEFVIVYVYIRIKYEQIPHMVSAIFGALIIFLMILYNFTYQLFR